MSRKSYWEGRYQEQGPRTVGHISFNQEEFDRKTLDAIKRLASFITRHDIEACRFLDFGCGVGRFTKELLGFFPEIHGIDISPLAIEQARMGYPEIDFEIYDGRIPFKDEVFDGCLSWTVLQHIPPEEIQDVCREISRVASQKAALILYENTSTLPDKPHIWYRSAENYRDLFPGFGLIVAEEIKDADGNKEAHSLMLMRKR